MNWVTRATTILQLVPALIVFCRSIEDAIPGQGLGEQKLVALRSVLETTNGQIGEYWPAIKETVTVLVGLFNATGVFQKNA